MADKTQFLSPEQLAKNREEFLQILRDNVKRDGVEDLIHYLENNDFFTAPSSTRFHGNYEGGLCEHSLNVYDCLVALHQKYEKFEYTDETLAIAALMHDLCKCLTYKKQPAFRKDADGRWEQYMSYKFDEVFPGGHGEKSCFISSVDIIKEVARRLGWNGEKDDKSRKFLSDLKDLSTQYSDAPLEYLTKEFNRVKDHDNVMLFMHIREPEEIQRAKERFGALTLLIKRPGYEPIQSNHADRDVDQFDYDYTIVNNGTMQDLEQQASDFIEKVKGGYFDKRREEVK